MHFATGGSHTKTRAHIQFIHYLHQPNADTHYSLLIRSGVTKLKLQIFTLLHEKFTCGQQRWQFTEGHPFSCRSKCQLYFGWSHYFQQTVILRRFQRKVTRTFHLRLASIQFERLFILKGNFIRKRPILHENYILWSYVCKRDKPIFLKFFCRQFCKKMVSIHDLNLKNIFFVCFFIDVLVFEKNGKSYFLIYFPLKSKN